MYSIVEFFKSVSLGAVVIGGVIMTVALASKVMSIELVAVVSLSVFVCWFIGTAIRLSRF